MQPLIITDEFKEELADAINDARYLDWVWDGEDETAVEILSTDDAVALVIEVLKKHGLVTIPQ